MGIEMPGGNPFGGTKRAVESKSGKPDIEKKGAPPTPEDSAAMERLYGEYHERRHIEQEGGLDRLYEGKPKRTYFFKRVKPGQFPFSGEIALTEDLYHWEPGQSVVRGQFNNRDDRGLSMGVHEFVKLQDRFNIDRSELKKLEELRKAVNAEKKTANLYLESGHKVSVYRFKFVTPELVECHFGFPENLPEDVRNLYGSHGGILHVPSRQFFDWQ